MSVSKEITAISNKMVLARNNFSVPQRRIISAIIESISPYLKDEISKKKGREVSFEKGVFDISKIIYRASDLSIPEHYSELRKALQDLRDKGILIETEDLEIYSSLITKYIFNKRTEYLTVSIDTDFYALLMDLTKGYTLYQTEVLLSFSSSYTMKMYEIIAKWRNVPQFEIKFEELRFLTDTQDKFLKNNDFKRYVLDYAKKELDKSNITDLRFSYKERKKGKAIVGFCITIIKTEHAHDHDAANTNKNVSLYWDFSKTLIENFRKYNLILKGKNLELVKTLVKEVGEQKLSLEMDMIFEKAKETANPQAYMIKSLKNYLKNATKEPTYMTVAERKKHAENIRKGETSGSPKSFGDLFKDLVDQQ